MHATPLPDIIILLLFAVGIVTLFRIMRINPVLGYLVAGALIGPKGFALIHHPETTMHIGEFGIIFLLFLIGLDLSWARLKAMRGQLLGIGSAQIILTMLVISAVALQFGLRLHTALIIGAALALSSTALVLQVLEQRGELAGQTGRMSLAILILQDLAVLPLLVLIPLLANRTGESPWLAVATTIGHAALGLGVILLAGRLVLRPLFRLIARLESDELFVATTLLVVFGISWATEAAGLSAALGAFLAGLLVAETEFQHQVEADVKPYKSLLMGLFFMAVGMRIDVAFILSNATAVLLIAAGILLVKGGLLTMILRAAGYPRHSAFHVGLLLSQGGEFGFILFGLAASFGVIPQHLAQQLLLAITLTMAATPLLDSFGMLLERRWWRQIRRDPGLIEAETRDMDGHVVLAGFGGMGQMIGHYLAEEKVPFVALETDPREVALARKNRRPVYYGDAARPDVLAAVGVKRAKALVITVHDPTRADAMTRAMRADYPDIPIFVRGRDMAHVRALELLGATVAVPELQVSGMRMLAALLAALGRPEEEVQRVMAAVRQ